MHGDMAITMESTLCKCMGGGQDTEGHTMDALGQITSQRRQKNDGISPEKQTESLLPLYKPPFNSDSCQVTRGENLKTAYCGVGVCSGVNIVRFQQFAE